MKLPFTFSIDKHLLYWICQFSFWGFVGIFTILTEAIQDNPIDFPLVVDTTFTMGGLMLVSHLYRYIILKYSWLKLLFFKLLIRIVVSTIIVSILATPINLLSIYIFRRESYSLDSSAIIQNVISLMMFYFFWGLGYFLYHYVSSYNRNLKWEALINEFELNQLKSQLNPHFIFNALNSVRALIGENPDKAKESINQLSNILRNSMMMDRKKVIPFNEELAIVQDYLALESTRYEERLRVRYNIDVNSPKYKVPPMMIQTLVENGIKHGIAKLKNGGEIDIETQIQNDCLVLNIRNTGKYEPKMERKEGYGLKSTRQRLDLLYHQKAKFSISNVENSKVLTEIIIPKWDESDLVVAQGGD